ncbi:MAG TPA: kelch repeat-containing protein [Candidatus Dormibacteraeota bacterium]|nr:kelch repeat-containing protein [Candidatus Dormibacteraeota bacterium]
MKLKRALFTFSMFSTFVCGTLLNAQVWTLEGPSSRHSHTAVFDPVSAQMIIFGGQSSATGASLNDVWLGVTSSTQSDSFTQEFPTGTAPQARYGHVAAYDSGSNRMTIFGGALSASSCANDVWILDGANGQSGTPAWVTGAPSGTAPTPRVNSAGAYDSTTSTLIVFGGNNCSSGYFNDVWVLSHANGNGGTPAWTQLATSGTPPSARQSASAVYDSVNNILTVYAGDAGIKTTLFSDVWTLSNANGNGGTPVWTKLTVTGTAPFARTGQSAIYDTASNRMTIFGGSSKTQTIFDSWILTSANGIGSPSWIQLKSSGTAPSLAYHSAVYNQSLGYMYVFAGSSTDPKLATNSHAFTMTGANGLAKVTPKWILGGPAVRYGQSAFYDSATNSFFVWGGQHSINNLNFNDYFQASNVIGSSNLKWSMVNVKSAPSPRYGQTGLYDSGSDRLMIFGGSTGTCQNDYHVLQHANLQGGTPSWLSLQPSGVVPPARTLQASAYDSATNTIVIFGGFGCAAATYYNDVWILSNANDVTGTPAWTQLSPAGTPPSVRESSSAIYDPTSNSLIVFGGDAGSTPFGDLWILSNANGTGGTPTWTQFLPLNSGPVARSGQTAIYDAVNNIMTIYGGYDGAHVLSDIWMLSGANGQTGSASWTQGVSGQPRRFASSQYDPVSNQMITFGGSSSTAPLVPSADLYTLTDANGLP